MAELTLTQRAAIAANPEHVSKIKSMLKKKANYWKDYPTALRSDVNKAVQKRKRFAKNLLLQPSYNDQVAPGVSEFFLMQYTTATPVFEGGDPNSNLLADTEYDSASFDASLDYFAGVQTGDDADTEIDW